MVSGNPSDDFLIIRILLVVPDIYIRSLNRGLRNFYYLLEKPSKTCYSVKHYIISGVGHRPFKHLWDPLLRIPLFTVARWIQPHTTKPLVTTAPRYDSILSQLQFLLCQRHHVLVTTQKAPPISGSRMRGEHQHPNGL